MKEKKKQLFTNVVSRICKKNYPMLLKQFKDDFFLEKIPLIFDTFDTLEVDMKSYGLTTSEEVTQMDEKFKTTASFLPCSNIIVIHLEQIYQCVKPMKHECDIEQVMCTVIISNIIHELMHYHQFVDVDFSDESKYRAECEAESATILFKIKNYDFLVKRLECIADVLFMDISSDLFFKIAAVKDRNNRDEIVEIAKRCMDDKNIGLKYMEYRKTDEFNLISRYVYSSYLYRALKKNKSLGLGEAPTYNSFIDDIEGIELIIKKIEGCKDSAKNIRLENNIDWNSMLANIGLPTIFQTVTIILSEPGANSDAISEFLNNLTAALDVVSNLPKKKIKKIDDKKLFKSLHRDAFPLGYALLLDLVKLDVSVENDTLLIKTVPLDVKRFTWGDKGLSLEKF